MKILNVLKSLPKCNCHSATLAAVAAIMGAACGGNFINWYWLLPFLLILFFFTRKQLLLTAATFALAFTSGIIQYHLTLRNQAFIPQQTAKISGTVLCSDKRASAIPELPPLSMYQGEVTVDGHTFDAAISYPANLRPAYGNSHRFTGIIYPAEPDALICSNGDISGEIPPEFGNKPIVEITQLHSVETTFAFFTFFLNCRDFLLKRLLANIKDPEICEMAAKMFFSASRGSSPETKQNFINSGIIHVFSVSGLHVVILSGIVLLLLRPLPFRLRHWLTAAITLFYILCTGASLPSLRAGFMMISWCILRSMLLPYASWNALMYSLTAFVIIAPATVESISAQYSFTITAALLMLAEKARFFSEKEKRFRALMPGRATLTRQRQRKFKWLMRLTMAPLSAATAFAAGCGISLYRQNIFASGSIPANLLLILITPLLFGAMIFKMLFGGILDLFDQIGAFFIESSFYLLTEITAAISGFLPLPAIAQIPLWQVVIFYLLLFAALKFQTVKIAVPAAFGTLLILILWQEHPIRPEVSFLAISRGSDTPALLAVAMPDGNCDIIDLPSETGRLAGRMLIKRGVRYADVSFSQGTVTAAKGVFGLKKFINVTLHAPSTPKNSGSKAFFKLMKNSETTYSGSRSHAIIRKESNRVYCRTRFGYEIYSEVTDSGRKIRVVTPDGKNFVNTLPWCSLPVVWQCELK